MTTPLEQFTAPTRQWFESVFASPTPAQDAAWPAISSGRHTLVVAPTGSGKTLAAFLWAIDKLASSTTDTGTQVLYVSPLKALAVDVERNLRAPLAGIRNAYDLQGLTVPDISVALRSGDTPAAERQRQLRHPSDILITTPESLYLLLTSRARETLRSISTVIVDEVHALAGAKRGAHLALSLERLDALLDHPSQRIGLSATVRPTDVVASFLGGAAPVDVVQPPTHKELDLSVVVPVEDFGAPTEGARSLDERSPSIWPHVESHIVDLVEAHRSTIVFANSRRLAERLAARLNEEAARRQLGDLPGVDAPAEIMAQAGSTLPVSTHHVIARAHHGSVSREQRLQIEEDLKAGLLPAVVATSTLELGIDMGAVDLVVQVESPPSVASGLQRIGRAGHHVDGVSRGVLFPKHRGDLIPTAVAVGRMHGGQIEALAVPRNPLDVLAQQVVAMVAMDDWPVDELATLVRRAHPFRTLPDSALDSVLDMLAGRYPSDAFAELKPRLVWDRQAATLTARPGTQQVAVVNAGTIPDRGLYGVFLADGDGPGRRVGELDEEMVYESRIGDVFALGSTSWQIVDITHDRVLVTPAPGRAGKLPFWHGDTIGRPRELGVAIGATVRALRGRSEPEARAALAAEGLDERAAAGAVGYLTEQAAATGLVPDDRLVVLEHFRDEIGDWRIVVHSVFGGRVNTPWAMVVAARLRDALDMDVQVMPSDDGIVLRLPDLGDEAVPDIGDHLLIDPDDVEQLATDAVWGSALFAARFRECAARALLLPRRRPDRRTPLWQQRQRSAQLLGVASGHPTFPIVLETMRECLQDVFDVPGLRALMTDLQSGQVRLSEVETPRPSPFASSLLFSYVGAFLYEGDAPLAERRAAALTVDTSLLAELLGQAELRELLEPEAIVAVEQRVGWLTGERRLRDVESVADALRVLGPLSDAQLRVRGAEDAWAEQLGEQRRAYRMRLPTGESWVAAEDLGRLRDALGVPLPPGAATAFAEAVADPVGDLVARFARTHGPFEVGDAAAALGLGPAVAQEVLERLAREGRLVQGAFRPGRTGSEWCDREVLRAIRRASLALVQQSVEPVDASALVRFLPDWQDVTRPMAGTEGLLSVLELLARYPAPASEWERSILPSRVLGYRPEMLDELTASGEVLWYGTGALPRGDGWIAFVPADQTATLLPDVTPADDLLPVHRALLEAVPSGAGVLTRQLAEVLEPLGFAFDTVDAALWDLVWAGVLTNDTLAAVRSALARTGAGPRRVRPTPYRPGRGPLRRPAGRAPLPPGRWSQLPTGRESSTLRAHAQAETLLARHGVLTRGVVAAEAVPGGFTAPYRVLSTMEEAGRVRRGYFVEGLGAAQFATGDAVDRLRGSQAASDPLVLAATDPANPFGAALPWPSAAGTHRPSRTAGATVVVDGGLALFVERGGRSMLTWRGDHDTPDRSTAAARALAEAVRAGRRPPLTLERVDGVPVHRSGWREPLVDAGFTTTPRALRLRPHR